MKRLPVSSDAIASVGYDARTGTLEVEFVSTEVYRYLDVPAADVEAFHAADSMGRYLNTRIKPRYRYVHIDAEYDQ